VYEFGSVTLILKGVVKECVTHSYLALLTLLDIDIVFQLLEPHPIIDIHALHDWILKQMIYNFDIVDNIKD